MTLLLGLLGGFDLRTREGPIDISPTAQRVVAFLALRERPQLREHVSGTLWGDFSADRSAANLRSALWRLRRTGVSIVEGREQLRLSGDVRVDVRDLAAQARALLREDPDRDDDLGDLWTSGELLPDWYDDWLDAEREQLRQLRLNALEVVCRRLTARQRFGQAVGAALAAVAAEPLRESAHRALIQAYLAQGNIAEALQQYRLYSALLREELGLAPSELMERLMGELRREGDAAVTERQRDHVMQTPERRRTVHERKMKA